MHQVKLAYMTVFARQASNPRPPVRSWGFYRLGNRGRRERINRYWRRWSRKKTKLQILKLLFAEMNAYLQTDLLPCNFYVFDSLKEQLSKLCYHLDDEAKAATQESTRFFCRSHWKICTTSRQIFKKLKYLCWKVDIEWNFKIRIKLLQNFCPAFFSFSKQCNFLTDPHILQKKPFQL